MSMIGAANIARETRIQLFLAAAGKGLESEIRTLLLECADEVDVNAEASEENIAIILAARVDVNAKDGNGNSAITLAAMSGHHSIVALLTDCPSVDVNAKTNKGYTAITVAALKGHHSIVAILADCSRVDMNTKNNRGSSAITFAALEGHHSIVAMLADCPRVDVDAKGARGTTAIFAAAWNGYHSTVDLLAEAGAMLGNPFGTKTLQHVVSDTSPEKKAATLAVLIKHGCSSNADIPLPDDFQSKYYFQDGQGKFYKRNVTEQIWINRKELILCLNYVFNWSVENQVKAEVYRTLPSDLTGVGRFVASCFFDVAGGDFGNGIARLITQYCSGFDASKSPFAFRGQPEYGKLPDNYHRCSGCLERKKKGRKSKKPALRDCASCGVVRYCGEECQKNDWERHKENCKLWTEEKEKKMMKEKGNGTKGGS
jgi:ankyrin repeat protein